MSHPMEIFKAKLNGALSNLLQSTWQGSWTRWCLEVLSDPNHSVILCSIGVHYSSGLRAVLPFYPKSLVTISSFVRPAVFACCFSSSLWPGSMQSSPWISFKWDRGRWSMMSASSHHFGAENLKIALPLSPGGITDCTSKCACIFLVWPDWSFGHHLFCSGSITNQNQA